MLSTGYDVSGAQAVVDRILNGFTAGEVRSVKADDAIGSYGRRASTRFSYWLVVLAAAAVLTLFAGVGVAVLVGREGAPEDWGRWSDVGQTFGVLSSIISALTLIAVVVTARVQFRELRRSAAAELSMLHLEIIKMSINDPKLAEVWPEFRPGLSVETNRQFLYANIIYQFHWTSLKLNNASDDDVFADMRYLFTSPLMRQYWAAAERARSFFEPGSPEFAFAKKLS